jgi:phosphatidylinositol 4-kinase
MYKPLMTTHQKYLSVSQSSAALGTSELGASVAEQFGKGIGPLNRHLGAHRRLCDTFRNSDQELVSLSTISQTPVDMAKSLASQIAIKGYYAGEAAGIRLSNCRHLSDLRSHASADSGLAEDGLTNPPPEDAPATELQKLEEEMAKNEQDIRMKKSALTIHDLRRLLYRCAAALISLKDVRLVLLASLNFC